MSVNADANTNTNASGGADTGTDTRPRLHAEPFLWLLFGGGGVASALLIPILLVLFGLAFPLGWISPPEHGDLLGLLSNPLIRIALLGFCVLAFFHWAHRFRYTLYDGLNLKHLHRPVSVFCYGGALVGSVIAGYLLLIYL